MIELTGGSVEKIHLKREQMNAKNLFNLMTSALKAGKLLGCAIYKVGTIA
jgi:hypothetical protein